MRRTVGRLCIVAALALMLAPVLARAQTVKTVLRGDSALLIAKMPQCTTACPDSILRVWRYRDDTFSRTIAPKVTDTLIVQRGTVAQTAQLSYTPFKTTRKTTPVAARVVIAPPVPVNQPPVAVEVASCVGLTCTFDGRGSTDDVGIVAYEWRDGEPTPVSTQPTWTKTLAVAGTRTWTLTVRDSGGLSNVKAFTFTASPPAPPVVTPPPPVVVPPVVTPPSGAFTPNLPAGLPLIVDTRFGSPDVGLTGGGTSGINYWNWSAPSSICRAIGDTLEITYPGNHLGNGTGGCLIAGPENQRWTEVYFAMSVFVPSNYSLHSNAEKWLYMLNAGDGGQQSTLIEWALNNEGPNSATFGLELLPNTGMTSAPNVVTYPNPWGGGPWVWIFQAPGTPRISKGAWHTVEVSLKMNTPGQQNGVYRLWVDGTLVMSGSNALFRGGATQGTWTGIRFDATRGGGASTTPTPAGGQVRRYGRLAWYAR